MGVVAQVFRCIFYFYGNDYGRGILVRRFGLFYSYEVVMQFIPFMIEYIFLVQIFEWQAMIFVIVT